MEKMKRLNEFQEEVLNRFSKDGITETDILIFTDESNKKLKDMGLPKKHCKTASTFVDAVDPDYHRREYCLKNCGLICLYALDEKIKRIQYLYDLPKSGFILRDCDVSYFTNQELSVLYKRGLIPDKKYHRIIMQRGLCKRD